MQMLKELFLEQKRYLNHFFERVDLTQAQKIVDLFLECKGSIFFSGVGKSGIIAEKLAMTLISTGTKAFYLPPTNALHGDLGIVDKEDLFVFLSKSGETLELLQLVPYVKQKGAKTIAWVSKEKSSLQKKCDAFIYLPVERELCPFDLVPTTSTAVHLLFGDVLAVALMRSKSFSLQDYAQNHPAGAIGKKIAYKVEDIMIYGEALPLCYVDQTLKEILPEFSEKKCGCVIVLDREEKVKGIFTDGDLRRALQKKINNLLDHPMEQLMTQSFLSVERHHLVQEAAKVMQKDINKRVTTLPVLDEERLVGLLRMHDVVQVNL